MLIQSQPPLHLAYGLNVYPGESARDHLDAILHRATIVRDAVAEGRPFGLGLRISAQAAEELDSVPGLIERWREAFSAEGMYAFTVNGFPYGRFHGARVKEQVYAPDWRMPERQEYTLRLARILSALLPEGATGSISTVPGSYRDFIGGEADEREMAARVLACARALADVERRTGRRILLAFEPEPDCWMERGDSFIRWHQSLCSDADTKGDHDAVRRHVGLCLDLCHAAVVGEDVVAILNDCAAAGVAVAKIQISGALESAAGAAAGSAWRAYEDPVYLHQVRKHRGARDAGRWPDLDAWRREYESGSKDAVTTGGERLFAHVHVPVFWPGDEHSTNTAAEVPEDFWRRVRAGASSHLEIETYTYSVLPEPWRRQTIEENVIREWQWVLHRLRP